ncbi:DUF4189 domain-containing protein [Pseudoxanthomonas gei]|uniref:DUF4189 domain-containing protein n=1 Tax=Pseudoxanthomonas gei TaxID=1383030 RepID=UPI001391289D
MLWEDRWGSIAVDFPGGLFGVASSMQNKEAAEAAAMADCQIAGGKDCNVDLSYYNQCGVVAWGENYAATASAGTKEKAASRALFLCGEKTGKCKIYYADCSLPERVE